MSYTAVVSESYSYTYSDIETVIRRFTADIVMIAQSSGAITEAKARDYAHDIEALARSDYLESVDITLLSGSTEVRAVKYVVNTASGELTMSRPGGVLWPRVESPYLRIVVTYTDEYTGQVKEAFRSKLRINWTPTKADTSHAGLKNTGGRDYASNAWGLQRKDYGA
jgi:hypothetical protein